MQAAHGTGKEQDARQQGERPLVASPRTRNQEGQACLAGVRVLTAGLSVLQGGVRHVPAAWWASKPPHRWLEDSLSLLQASATSPPSLGPGGGLRGEIIISLRGREGQGSLIGLLTLISRKRGGAGMTEQKLAEWSPCPGPSRRWHALRTHQAKGFSCRTTNLQCQDVTW